MSDAFDRADSAKPASPKFYGQISVNAYDVVLIKGQGKVRFDPAQHKPGELRTAIDLTVTLLSESIRKSDKLERGLVAESAEWTRFTLPSLKALGFAGLRSLNGTWCALEFEPTGQTYTANDGTVKEKTAFKFVALYADEASCRNAYFAENSGIEAAPTQTTQPAPAPVASDEKAIATQFLKALVANANGDMGKLATLIAGYPVVSKYYTADSPEVLAMLQPVAV